MELLDRLAAAGAATPALQRLRRLCLDDPDEKFSVHILTFLASDASIEILTEWAYESPQAAGLELLARAAWAHAEVLDAVRPARQIARVETRFKRTELRTQYPAALAAAPALTKDGSLARWLQRLICYLLLRSIDAVEDGVLRDEHLYTASLTAREAWQSYEHTRHAWLAPLLGDSSGLVEFEADTIIRCRQARRHAVERARDPTPLSPEEAFNTDDTSPLRFYDALLAILEHRPWRPLPIATARTGAQMPLTLAPHADVSSKSMEEQIQTWLALPAGGVAQLGEPDGDGATVTTQPTNRRHSQKRKERLGTKVRVEHLVESLYLPCHWNNLSPAEEEAVRARAEVMLSAGPLIDRLGAALTLVAQVASTSIHDAEAIPLRPGKHHAWHLDLEVGQLSRTAPRFARRWKADALTDEERSWLRPILQDWRYQLVDRVLSVLREARQVAPDSSTLGELWAQCHAGQYLERWFCLKFLDAPGLRRLAAPSTSGSIALEVFRNSADPVLAQLVGSDHRTALPASSTYGSFTGSEITAALGGLARMPAATLITPATDSSTNVAGSELDIVESRVFEAITGLIDRLKTSSVSDDWVAHHNLLTALVTIALLASSGARPTNSPFQSLTWFDFDRALMFVEDKYSGPSKGSRICVLSDVASGLLRTLYIPHLRHLASGLRDDAPEFAREVERVLAADPDACLPLLFFIRNKPALDWQEVTRSQLEVLSGLNWPLPWNALRHWMSTGLRRGGVHADVRDALMGHAQHGAEPHGDVSPRIPAQDIEAARETVNRMQDRIGLQSVNLPCEPRIAGVGRSDTSLFEGRGNFGRQARQERREAALSSAQQLARREIEAYLDGRPIDELTDQQVDELARKMLFRGSLPHSFASIRYEVLETYIQEQWARHGRQTRLSRRYIIARSGQCLFGEHALLAGRAIEDARAAFERMVEAMSRAVDGPVLAATLAAIDIVLYSGLAHMPPLTALLTNSSKQFRLVTYQQRYWYEWALGGEWHDGKPVLRIEISQRAFDWVSALLSSDRSLHSTPQIPRVLQSWSEAVKTGATNVGQVLRQLVRWADECNAFALPGYQAAHLSGRRTTSALPHADWVRIMSGKATCPNPDRSAVPDSVEAGVDVEAARLFFRNHNRVSSVTAAQSLSSCTELIDGISAVLAQAEPEDGQKREAAALQTSSDAKLGVPNAKREEKARTAITNSQKAYAISRLVDASGFGHGDAPWLLADFMVHVLTRKPRRGKADRLRGSTALRYWHSLARPFRDAVADRNFIGADEEDLTEWYGAIVEAWDATLEAPSGMGNATDSDGKPASDSPLRTIRQLLEFHDFFQEHYGGVDPDWAEVAPDITAPVGRPGTVRLAEYRVALRSLVQPGFLGSATGTRMQAAFVMLVCFRYGLRISEAVGLSRQDLIVAAGSLTILVRSNRIRPLKTSASRRVVPQLEPFDDLEREIIERIVADWTRHEGIDERKPLLIGLSPDKYKTTKARIGATLLSLLKSTTMSPLTTVHHLRHAFAMRTLATALQVPFDDVAPSTDEQTLALRQLILGHADIDRRLMWAIARLLGHSSPACTLKSYLNCVQFYMKPLTNAPMVDGPRRSIRPGSYIDLDSLVSSPDYLQSNVPDSNVKIEGSSPKIAAGDLFIRSLQLLRLIIVGREIGDSIEKVGLLDTDAKTLASAFARVAARINAPDSRYAGFKVLGGMTPDRMAQLIRYVASLDLNRLNEGRRVDDWLYTFGASRQVLLYEQEHFHAAADFVAAIGLPKESVIITHAVGAHADLMIFVDRAGLTDYLCDTQHVPVTANSSRFAKAFQLDVAKVGPRGLIQPHRMALIPKVGGLLRDTYELASLWLLWNISAALSARRSTPD